MYFLAILFKLKYYMHKYMKLIYYFLYKYIINLLFSNNTIF